MASLNDFKFATENKLCDFCGSNDFVLFNNKMRHNINLETRVCTTCLLVQTNPQPVRDSIQDFYTNYYHLFHKRNGVDEAYLNKSKKAADRRFQLLAKFIEPSQLVSLLEIGPGAGQFLELVSKKSQWLNEGIELGKESFEWCRSLGLDVKYIGIEEFNPGRKFNTIVSFHVLEHVASPRVFFHRCAEMINDGGCLYLEVPNFNRPGYMYSKFLQFPHLYNFTLLTLSNYLNSFGFRPVFIDESVSNLTIISKKIASDQTTTDGAFVKTDVKKYLNILKWKERVYRYSEWIPSFFILRKLKSLIRSIY